MSVPVKVNAEGEVPDGFAPLAVNDPAAPL